MLADIEMIVGLASCDPAIRQTAGQRPGPRESVRGRTAAELGAIGIRARPDLRL
jgi:hypothetical protein